MLKRVEIPLIELEGGMKVSSSIIRQNIVAKRES